MKGVIRPILDLGDAEVAQWRALVDRVADPNPLFEPECLLPAARHLPNGPRMLLVTAEDDGVWHACFPVQAEPSWRALRRPALVTKVRRMDYDATPLVDPSRATEAWSAIFDVLRGADGLPGLLVFNWLDDGVAADSMAEAAARRGVTRRVYHRWERPILRRMSAADYRARHSKKTMATLARKRRSLGRQLGGEVQFHDRSMDPAAVEVVLELEAAGYKGQNGVAILTKPGEPEWFRDMCERFRRVGRLHLHTLEVGDRPVAAQLFLGGGDGIFLCKLTYDEELARYSPGIQLHFDTIDHFHRTTDAAWVDSCTYENNPTLLWVYPDRRTVSSTVVATGGLVDRLFLAGVTGARRVLGRSQVAAASRNGRPASAALPTEPSDVVEVATARR